MFGQTVTEGVVVPSITESQAQALVQVKEDAKKYMVYIGLGSFLAGLAIGWFFRGSK